LRAVYFGAKVLILDEPTSALGVRRTANVLATIDRVRKNGIGVVFITHNVRHALAVGDRFIVLNRGRTLATAVRGNIAADEMQDMMAGVKNWSPSNTYFSSRGWGPAFRNVRLQRAAYLLERDKQVKGIAVMPSNSAAMAVALQAAKAAGIPVLTRDSDMPRMRRTCLRWCRKTPTIRISTKPATAARRLKRNQRARSNGLYIALVTRS
jgi:ABC-type uncharacterized transport system ATPase subunit